MNIRHEKRFARIVAAVAEATGSTTEIVHKALDKAIEAEETHSCVGRCYYGPGPNDFMYADLGEVDNDEFFPTCVSWREVVGLLKRLRQPPVTRAV